MEQIWQDIRFAIRVLAKNPGFALVVVLTLGLGIGANTTIFTVVDRMLLRPLPVKNPGELVVPAGEDPTTPFLHPLSYLDMKDFRDQTKDCFQDMAGYFLEFVGMSAENRPERLTVSFVTGNYFSMLGVQPAAGRLILPSEGEVAGADPVIVLGNSYWKRRFGGDPNVVGKAVQIDGQPFTIAGVVPAEFLGTYTLIEMDGYIPVNMIGLVQDGARYLTGRQRRNMHTIARLQPGVSIKRAESALQVVAQRLDKQYPDTNAKTTMHLLPERMARPEEDGGSDIAFVSWVFLGLVGLVLLLACVNVANILLARGTMRQKELAIRAAMGARRERLVRQLLTEIVLLALFGGVAGIAFGEFSARLISSIPLAVQLPIRMEFTADWRVILFAIGVSFAAGIVAGFLPALRTVRSDLQSTLREGGRGNSGGREHHRMRNILVGMQVSLSVMLLVVAGLFSMSFMRSHSLDLGFEPHGVMNAVVDVQFHGYNEDQGRAFYRQLLQRIRSLPGVDAATLALSVPMGYSGAGAIVDLPGDDTSPQQAKRAIQFNSVEPNYLELMRIPLIQGRSIAETDTEQSTLVAVINDTMAKRLWPGQNPIGKRFRMKRGSNLILEVVGVTRTGKYSGVVEDPTPFFYIPASQDYRSMRFLQVRSALPPETVGPMIVKAIRDLDGNLPIYDVQSMDESLAGANGFFLFKLGAYVAAALGLLGLTLAVVGVYGVVNQVASQRTHEIGLRMALGAAPRDILTMILRSGLGVVLAGTAVGLVGALGFSRLLASMLVGVRTYDPPTYLGVAVLLSAVALVACYIPARRAMRVDPMVALRYE